MPGIFRPACFVNLLMTYCSNCGTANRATSKFCNNCGALLGAPVQVHCAVCGTVNKADSGFCSNCGARLEGQPIIPAQPADSSAPGTNRASPVLPLEEKEKAEKNSEDIGAAAQDEPARSPQVPQWVSRLRSGTRADTNRTESSTPHLAPGVLPAWMHELAEAQQHLTENSGGEEEGDWLAKLRAVAATAEGSIEPAPLPVEKVEAANDDSDPPIPRWFEHIRPPVTIAPPAPKVAAAPGDLPLPPDGDAERLPEWLKQLHAPDLVENDAAPNPRAAGEGEKS